MKGTGTIDDDHLWTHNLRNYFTEWQFITIRMARNFHVH